MTALLATLGVLVASAQFGVFAGLAHNLLRMPDEDAAPFHFGHAGNAASQLAGKAR